MMTTLIALAILAAVTAVPIENNIRSAIFCKGWSPLGTDYVSGEDPFNYYCTASSDKRSLTLRVMAPDAEDSYTYLMMAAVDSNGNALIEGEYKIDHRLRTLHCDDDKSTRVLKVDENKVDDIIATYHLPEDKEVTLEGVNCRFAVAKSFQTYYRDVIVDQSGEIVSGHEIMNETDLVPDDKEPEIEVIVPDVEAPAIEVIVPDVKAPAIEVIVPDVDESSHNMTEYVDNSTDVHANETSYKPHQVPDVKVHQTDKPETVAVDDDTENFLPTDTVDETDDLHQKFEKEETLGHEVSGDKDATPTVVAPDVPDEKNELKNEGEEIEPEFITDEFGIKRMVMTEKEEKLIYKGEPTGLWCGADDNIYVLAKGTDCKMFYHAIMQVEDSKEVFPLSSNNCPPGTRFNTVKCVCDFYHAMVCPDPNPDFEITTTKPDTVPIFPGNDVDNRYNETEIIEPIVDPNLKDLNETSQFQPNETYQFQP